MECQTKVSVKFRAALLQAEMHMNNVQMDLYQYLSHRRRKQHRQQQRRYWSRSWLSPGRQRQFGLYDQLMVELRKEDHSAFCNFMRIPPDMFDEILTRVGPPVTKNHTWMREPLEPGLKLALALRHLASGATYMDMRYGWRVPHNTILLAVREVCQAIVDEYLNEVMPLPTDDGDWQEIVDGFMKKWNFPHTLRALDGKHIRCKKPPGSGSTYFNYKKFFSILLLGLVDADYKFVWVDIGGRSAAGDAQVWNESDLKEAVDNEKMPIPKPAPLPKDNVDVSYFFIGDDAFALRPTMQKPFSLRGMSREERVFNYKLSRARRVVENALGILANRFRILLTTMQHQPSTVRLITTACICLHNLMRIRYPKMHNHLVDTEDTNHNVIPGERKRGRNMRDCVVAQGPNRDNREGKKLRNILKHWVNSPAGSVPWQDRMI